MSEYFFTKENQPVPIYEVPEGFEEGAYSTRFTFPSNPIPLLAKYKPRSEYEIVDILLDPELCLSKKLFDTVGVESIYGGNWIPIKLIDKGEHDFMMLQLANEIDILDHTNSQFEFFEDDSISGMSKVVIDPRKLESTPLHKRLVFREVSWGFHVFYHKTFVDVISGVAPKGVEFVPVEDFNESWAG